MRILFMAAIFIGFAAFAASAQTYSRYFGQENCYCVLSVGSGTPQKIGELAENRNPILIYTSVIEYPCAAYGYEFIVERDIQKQFYDYLYLKHNKLIKQMRHHNTENGKPAIYIETADNKYKVENKHEDLSKGAGCFKCEPIEIKDFQYDHRRFSDRPSTRYDRIVKMIETGEAMR